MSDNSMTFEQYSYGAGLTAKYPNAGEGELLSIVYTTLGLAGEASEVSNKVKKIIRDDGGVVSDEKREAIAAEIGDVLWYAARLAAELGFSLGDIAQMNLDKLESRNARGVISGSGDQR